MSDTQAPLDFGASGAAPAATACSVCREPLVGSYFTVGPSIACERCKTQLALSLQQQPGASAYLRAVLYAIVPGALGAAVWWGVRTYAGYEIGLIAIGIGYFVGLAVMRASGNRGGIPFQLLAVALTYFWITANYVPDIVGEIARADEPVAAQSGQAEVPSGEASATAGGAAIAFVLIVGISLAAPFLQGAENLIGLLIIGFGLWQAWSLNKRNDVAIAGPFDLAASPPAAPGG